ncbi:MAG: hypothetical protein ACP5T4_01380 [Candidatus Micrarchaeia archaeon]
MSELELPNGVKAEVSQEGDEIKISGSLGSTRKRINTKLLEVKVQNGKLVIEKTPNQKLEKKALLAEMALTKELKEAIEGVQNGITRHMRVVYAHFPISFEIKGNLLLAKNFYGEHLPRAAKIIGDTKVEIKGQDIYVKGVDPYDVNQTVANLFKLSFQKNKDSRIFQDGIYPVKE